MVENLEDLFYCSQHGWMNKSHAEWKHTEWLQCGIQTRATT